MIVFAALLAFYVGALVFYRPQPESLKSERPTIGENVAAVKASLTTGILLLVFFLAASAFGFREINEGTRALFGLSNIAELAFLWPMQAFTHLLIHENIQHLVSNLVCIGIASAYERRAGSKRFLMVLLAGGLASIPSIAFYSEPTIVTGISGGIFALGAAYFTDHENLTAKEWLGAVLMFVFLAAILSFANEYEASADEGALISDHIGHALGALGGILYCRLRPTRPVSQPEPA